MNEDRRRGTAIRERISYANVMATVAVFIALGGGAYATHTHRMGTQDLQNRAVTAPKLANGSVTPRAVRNNAIRPRHVASETIGTRHIADGAVNSAKVAESSLTGDDIDQSTLTDIDADLLRGNAPGDFGAGLMMARINGLAGQPGPDEWGSPSGLSTPDPFEDRRAMILPAEMVVGQLRVDLTAPPGPGFVRGFQLMADGAAVATCVTLHLETTCSDSSTQVRPAGTRISIRHTPGAFGAADAMVSWRATMQ